MPLLLLLLVGLILAVAAAVLLMARSLLQPPRMTDGKALYLLKRLSPDDLGMAYERVMFAVRDEAEHRELKLTGWWIPHPAGGDRTVVLIHGYADAKVGAIGWAPTWRGLGYHILAIDLRAHGESEGTYATAGVRERSDLDQVLNQLRAAKPSQTARVVLFGVSLGSCAVLGAAEMRDDVAAIVLESPIAHFRSGVRAHAELLGLPLPSLLPVVMKAAGWMSGADLDSVQPTELMKRSKCPILVIQSGDDPFVPEADAKAICEAIEGRGDGSAVWHVDGAAHLMAMTGDPEGYRERIGRFLDGIR